MLSKDDLASFRGLKIIDAEIRESDGRQVLRLRESGGCVLAVTARGDELLVADETSIP